jgi:hypothetical protein
MFARQGERIPPNEQRWVMRSVGLKFPQRAGLTVERCA